MTFKLEPKQHIVEFIERIEGMCDSLTERDEIITEAFKLSILYLGIQTSSRGKEYESFFQTTRLSGMTYDQVKEGLISETFRGVSEKKGIKPSVAYLAETNKIKCIHCKRSNHKSENCYTLKDKRPTTQSTSVSTHAGLSCR